MLPPSIILCGRLLLVLGEELRALGVLLGGGIVGAVAALNPFAGEGRTVALHALGATDGVEVVEGEDVVEQRHQVGTSGHHHGLVEIHRTAHLLTENPHLTPHVIVERPAHELLNLL